MELKDRIREAMVGAGLKKLQFAKAIGVSSGAVTQWLDGTTKSLKAVTAARMQQVTGFSSAWIISGKGSKLAIEIQLRPIDELTPTAIEIAALFDLIPVSDKIQRARAYNAATAAILALLQPDSAKPSPDLHPKKLSA